MRDDIKKRREKYNITTRAQKLFGGDEKKLLLERPEGMSQEGYREMRSIQSRAGKILFRKSPNPEISRVMIPAIPSLHLQKQVALAKALKYGYAEEVVPVDKLRPNFLIRFFNFIRNLFGQNGTLHTSI